MTNKRTIQEIFGDSFYGYHMVSDPKVNIDDDMTSLVYGIKGMNLDEIDELFKEAFEKSRTYIK